MVCNVCLQKRDTYLKCSGCYNRVYCSTHCQKIDWASHQDACRDQQVRKFVQDIFGRIAFYQDAHVRNLLLDEMGQLLKRSEQLALAATTGSMQKKQFWKEKNAIQDRLTELSEMLCPGVSSDKRLRHKKRFSKRHFFS